MRRSDVALITAAPAAGAAGRAGESGPVHHSGPRPVTHVLPHGSPRLSHGSPGLSHRSPGLSHRSPRLSHGSSGDHLASRAHRVRVSHRNSRAHGSRLSHGWDALYHLGTLSEWNLLTRTEKPRAGVLEGLLLLLLLLLSHHRPTGRNLLEALAAAGPDRHRHAPRHGIRRHLTPGVGSAHHERPTGSHLQG